MALLNKPKLILDWNQVPDWVICVRSTTGNYFKDGLLVSAAVNELRVQNNGLLIEPQRRNSLLYSRNLSNAAWSNNSFVTQSGVGLDGVSGSCSYVDVSTEEDFTQAVSVTSGDYVVSCWIKRHPSYDGDVFVSADGSNFVPVMANVDEFTRVFISVLATTTPEITIRTSGKIYVDGCQIEQGTTPTLPIHTTTVAVTRNADTVSFGIDLWNYNPLVGSWLIKAELMEITTTEQALLFASESTPTADYMKIATKIDTDRLIYIAGYGVDNEYQIVDADIDSALGFTANTRICSTYSDNAYAYINGMNCALPTTAYSAGINYNTLDTVWVGSQNGDTHMNGVVTYLAYYDYPVPEEDGILLTR